ncbi:MAG: chemotaxis protein CheW [Planctomycetales bacterium]
MDDEILQEFLAESWENLARLDTEIVSLERQPNDHGLLASIFRTIHTIKGTCGFIGLTGLGSVAHAAENVLGQMRDGKLAVTPTAISLVLRGVDQIKELLHGLEETGNEPVRDNSNLIRELNALADSALTPETTSPAATAENTVAETLAEAPPVAPPAPATPIATPPAANDHVPPVDLHDHEGEPSDPNKKSVSDLSIRVNVDVLDRLMNLVGELVLTRNQLLQLDRGEDESKYAAPITQLNRVTTDLQEGVMKTRMQPIGNAWSKLPRLVRDLSQQTGKQIELVMNGAETELDRTVLDAIKDPLTHMVRNSADHGLEMPHIRRGAGKSETGTIRLNAYHEGGHVIICIEDDGGGINIDRVRQKAVQNSLLTEQAAAHLTDKEILSFIFEPGFSTAEKVTSVSGRGVGMDVVRTQVERIGGTIDLSSKPGKGTTIRIKIPLTLAIISALVVECGGLSFAIPQLGVVELVRLSPEERHKIERINENEVFRLRNRLLPLVHLSEVLDLEESEKPSQEQETNIVVVQVGDDQFGLIVSQVFDTEEIVVKPVGHLLKDIDIFQGTTILGDGRVIMILDVAGIASQFSKQISHGNDRESRQDGDAALHNDQMTSLLLFNVGNETVMSVPLSLVARLEEVSQANIERTGDRLVVQYRGDLLPLLPVEGMSAESTADPQPVIVFSEGNKSMGLMVEQIRDIVEDRLVIRMQSRRPGVIGTAIINDAATDILDIQHYINIANPDWFKSQGKQENARVLVVDDSVFFRQLVTTSLESEGYRVVAAESAVRAVELIEGGLKTDLIVCDIDMPMMDGFEFAEWIRERADFKGTPLIALTSLMTQKSVERGEQAGFNRYLQKFDVNVFLTTVREFIQQRELLGVNA